MSRVEIFIFGIVGRRGGFDMWGRKEERVWGLEFRFRLDRGLNEV